MDWAGFCKRLIEPYTNEESSLSAEVEGGIDKGLPQAKFKFSLGMKGRPSDDLDYYDKIANSWTEHDVCKNMMQENIALVIDDFERANDDIVRRVSDMCKLLTQSYSKRYAKIIVIGTGDICKRLFDANLSLESRLQEISIGTIGKKYESWKFLQLGFEALGLRHPANDKYIEKVELAECVQAVYEAADGLPKSLNELGREISFKGEGGRRISPKDIKDIASHVPKNNLKIFRREYPLILKCIQNNPVVRAVVEFLYREGIGDIHNWSELVTAMEPTYTEEQVDNAICELINVQFLVKTGRHGDIFFVSQPTLAHTMGVLVAYHHKYKLPPSMYGKDGQLVFTFLQKDDSQIQLPSDANKSGQRIDQA